MGFLDKLKSRTEQARVTASELTTQIAEQMSTTVQNVKAVVNTAIPTVTEENRNKRFEICKACPEFMELTSQCKKCGCFMKVKTALESAKCPMGKW